MNLQKKTIQRYKQFFPNETLRETSARTGIQITRVFRLLNGKPMKVGELEAFENVIQLKLKENPTQIKLADILEGAAFILTNSEMDKIIELIERKTQARTFGRMYISGNDQETQTA